MASECAVIGTPSIYVNSLSAGTLENQEKNGLLSIFKSSDGLIEKAINILNNSKVKKQTKQKSQDLIKNKMDLNILFYRLISGYPNTVKNYINKSSKK